MLMNEPGVMPGKLTQPVALATVCVPVKVPGPGIICTNQGPGPVATDGVIV